MIKKLHYREFRTNAELDEYFSSDELVCFECGKEYIHLGQHVSRTHKITPNEYRDRWGIPRTRGLAGNKYRMFHADKINALFKSGQLKVDKVRLLKNTASIDYKNRAPMKSASLKAANDGNPYRVVYSEPVIRNGDGRNIQRRNEYMRAWVAQKSNGDDSLMRAYRLKYGRRFKRLSKLG